MERHLTDTDPGFVRLFAAAATRSARGRARTMHEAGPVPRLVLAVGMFLMVAGSAVAAAPVAVFGIVLAVAALGIAHTMPAGGAQPGFA